MNTKTRMSPYMLVGFIFLVVGLATLVASGSRILSAVMIGFGALLFLQAWSNDRRNSGNRSGRA